jgi:hypothetical protein
VKHAVLRAVLTVPLALGCAANNAAGDPVGDMRGEHAKSRVASATRSATPRLDAELRAAAVAGRSLARIVVRIADIPDVELPAMLDAGASRRAVGAPPSLDLNALSLTEMYDATRSRIRCPNPSAGRPSHVVRLERVSEPPDQVLALELLDGVLDEPGCHLLGDARPSRIVAKEVFPELVYAFRFIDRQRPGLELVSFVMPPGTLATSKSEPTGHPDLEGAFCRATLPLRYGTAQWIALRTSIQSVRDWHRGVVAVRAVAGGDLLLVGVELTHTGNEPEPQLVVHVGRLAVVSEP